MPSILLLCFLLLFSGLKGDTYPSIERIYHPVTTTSRAAQSCFDRGLTYNFAYNHDLAFREFERATQYDPNCAMAYWGMALALGQNVNTDVTPENELRCYAYIQKAKALLSIVTPPEEAYINAMATRYTNDPKADLVPLRSRYRNAMSNVVKDYPEDLDAATLYAESILEINPWKWWTNEGKPTEGVEEAIAVLGFVLKRNPYHVGANHFAIHAWEESPTPERALTEAFRLETLLPDSGHLLHMPCHIFLPLGFYEDALKTNMKGIEQDRNYIARFGMNSGHYPLHYLTHNLTILIRTYMLMENYDNALKSAFEAAEFVQPHWQEMPFLASVANQPLPVYLYFKKWNEILNFNLIANTPYEAAFWHFARALAFAHLGNRDSALQEQKFMQKSIEAIPEGDERANNPTRSIMALATLALQAKLEPERAVELFNQGVALQDTFNYDEPPAWYVPMRQELGFALLRERRYADAEVAFKETLQKLQRNGRTLNGLWQSLKGQNKVWDAFWIEREMQAALKYGCLE